MIFPGTANRNAAGITTTGRRPLEIPTVTAEWYRTARLRASFGMGFRGTMEAGQTLDRLMIDSLLNLLFRCPHRRLTRPVAPITKTGQPHSQSYVVCLDCGKQFEYDLKEMRIGRPIDQSHEAGVVPPKLPKPRNTRFKYAVLAGVPAAFVLGTLWKHKKKLANPQDPPADSPKGDGPDGEAG